MQIRKLRAGNRHASSMLAGTLRSLAMPGLAKVGPVPGCCARYYRRKRSTSVLLPRTCVCIRHWHLKTFRNESILDGCPHK
jgi:hypothetical protein